MKPLTVKEEVCELYEYDELVLYDVDSTQCADLSQLRASFNFLAFEQAHKRLSRRIDKSRKELLLAVKNR